MRSRFHLTKERLIVVLLLASVICCFLGPALARRVRPVVQVVLVPFTDGGMYLTTAFRSHAKEAITGRITQEEAHRLEKEVEEYRRENDYLRKHAQDLEKRLGELQVLSQAFEPSDKFAWELVPARVVMADALPYGAGRVINVGGDQGVRVGEKVLLTERGKAVTPMGLPVVSTAALVGRVSESSSQVARLQLVTDNGFRCKARVLRDPRNAREVTTGGRLQPLTAANSAVDTPDLQGDGLGGMFVPDVKAYHNVRVGDRVVTGDADYLLPAMVIVGTVVEVREYRTSPGFVMLKVKPAADLETLRDVYVVVPHM